MSKKGKERGLGKYGHFLGSWQVKIADRGAGETKNVGTRRSKGTGPWRESERERKKKEGEGEREERGEEERGGGRKRGERGRRKRGRREEERERETGKESHQESEELTKDEVLLTETFAL